MPKYKLSYFNGRGRAEVSRMLFALAGKEYEDERVEMDQWASMKEKTPFHAMPLLEVDGVLLCQSNAIARYLAKSFVRIAANAQIEHSIKKCPPDIRGEYQTTLDHVIGLTGKNEMDQAKGDMIVDAVEEIITPAINVAMEPDKGIQAVLKKRYEEKQLPVVLAGLESIVNDKYAVGDELTWADLAIVTGLEFPTLIGVAFDIDKHPKLKKLKSQAESSPKIAAWIEKRPKTDF